MEDPRDYEAVEVGEDLLEMIVGGAGVIELPEDDSCCGEEQPGGVE